MLQPHNRALHLRCGSADLLSWGYRKLEARRQ
jgi:hypothetical protein